MPKTNNLVVFGNPPYQSEDGGHGKSAKPIYHLFVEAVVKKLKPLHHSFIIPSRFMQGGKSLDGFRKWMLAGAPVDENDKEKHISHITDFKSATEVFPEVTIAGGVCFYHWERNHDGPCMYNKEVRKLDEYDIFVRDNKAGSILRKVHFKHKAKWMDGVVSASKPYGFRADTTPSEKGTPCWFKQSQGLKFVESSIVKDTRNDLGKWKVLAPRAPIAGRTDFSKPLGFFTKENMFIAKPNECCTETYLVLNSFDSETEAVNFREYVKTKFFRFMLSLRVVSQDVPSGRYAFVPDLGDYSKPVTDAGLYAKFGLTKEEIAHIESKIKA